MPRWKMKGSNFFQPPLFFFVLPKGRGGKIAKNTQSTGNPLGTERDSRYRMREIGRRSTPHGSARFKSTGEAVRQRHTDRLRRIS
jgi:hypothetical protein